jgi:hypothetical protein
MVEQLKAKRVPWQQIEKYLEVHQGAIAPYLDLLKNKMIEYSEIETKLPKSFLQLHEVISQILRDNDILSK